MPNVHLTPQMQEFAEREIATGAFANLSEVVRAGMRKLMEERGAAAFHALKADLNAAADELEAGRRGAVRPARLGAGGVRVGAWRSGSRRRRRAISTGSGLAERWGGRGCCKHCQLRAAPAELPDGETSPWTADCIPDAYSCTGASRRADTLTKALASIFASRR